MRNKRLFQALSVASAAALVLSGCGSSDSTSDSGLPKVEMMKELGAGEGQVNVVVS